MFGVKTHDHGQAVHFYYKTVDKTLRQRKRFLKELKTTFVKKIPVNNKKQSNKYYNYRLATPLDCHLDPQCLITGCDLKTETGSYLEKSVDLPEIRYISKRL